MTTRALHKNELTVNNLQLTTKQMQFKKSQNAKILRTFKELKQ